MLSREIFGKRCFTYAAAAAIGAWFIGTTSWTAGLIACGTGPACCGGCVGNVQADGRYTNYDDCDIVQANVFFPPGQAVLVRYSGCVVPGPNVQPITDPTGMQISMDGSPNTDGWVLPCNTTQLQSLAEMPGYDPHQIIPHTICPHQ